jgi:hypothetical protein
MMQRRQFKSSGSGPVGGHLWLATSRGRSLPPRSPRDMIAPIDAPELPMEVTFEGLTEAQQRAAISAFPGGRRFTLAATTH